MTKKRHYFIYAHINKINGKMYVGQTSQKDPKVRWKNGKGYKGCRYLLHAIKNTGGKILTPSYWRRGSSHKTRQIPKKITG